MIPAGVFNQGSDDAMIVEVRPIGSPVSWDVSLPLVGTTDVEVDWGDGTTDYYNTAGQKLHTYTTVGTFEIKITGSLHGWGLTSFNDRDKVYAIHSWGSLGLVDLTSACQGLVNIGYVAPPPSTVTNMNSMFNNATNFNGDISGWNVSNVTSMTSMFSGATSFNQDLSGWCVINISSQPTFFATNTPSWTLPKPVWGTCP